MSNGEIENVEKTLLKLYANSNIVVEPAIEPFEENNKMDAFLIACGQDVSNRQTSTSKKRPYTIKEEISKYKAAILGNNKSICEFWNKNQFSFPILASAVRKYCIIPAASIPSESRFSTANYVARKERSNLSSKNLRFTMISREKSKISNIKINETKHK